MKKSFVIAAVCAVVTGCSALAQPVMKFEEKSHNFGIFDEAIETVSYNFEFTNTGNEPLVIKNVRTTCGCTASEYTQTPVAPGAKGSIKVTYNAIGRPGRFSKGIYVCANSQPERSILRITGEVVKGDHPQSVLYAYKIGNLKLKTLHIPLSKVVKGKTSSGFIEVINASQDTLCPVATNTPKHIRARIVPDTLLPGEEGRLVITYNPDAIDDWGYRRDEFTMAGVTADNKPLSEAEYKTISVSATITDDFDSMSEEEKANAPILVTGKRIVDFGIVTGSQKVRQIIYIANVGYSPLIIRKVRNENAVITAKPKKTTLKPGQSTQLIIEIDPKRAHSNLLLSDIYIVSNDPTNSSQQIRITVEFQ